MNLNNIYNKLKEIHSDIRKSNDCVAQSCKRIQAVLYNLEIISEHLAEGKIIDPITHELQLILNEINKDVTDLISDRRRELINIMNEFEVQLKELK